MKYGYIKQLSHYYNAFIAPGDTLLIKKLCMHLVRIVRYSYSCFRPRQTFSKICYRKLLVGQYKDPRRFFQVCFTDCLIYKLAPCLDHHIHQVIPESYYKKISELFSHLSMCPTDNKYSLQ